MLHMPILQYNSSSFLSVFTLLLIEIMIFNALIILFATVTNDFADDDYTFSLDPTIYLLRSLIFDIVIALSVISDCQVRYLSRMRVFFSTYIYVTIL